MTHENYNECIVELPYDGTLEEKLIQWLQANGGGSGTLEELWMNFLTDQGIPTGGTIHERKMLFYDDKGFTGTIGEREAGFFCGGAVLDVDGYDFTLSNTLDDGRELIGFFFTPAAGAGLSAQDVDVNGYGFDDGDVVSGFSFPAVTYSAPGPCVSAELHFYVPTLTVPGTFGLRGELADMESPPRWTTSHRPSSVEFGSALNSKSSQVVPVIGSIGLKVINVKPIVDEILASALWTSGMRMNFYVYTTSAGAWCTFGQVGGATPPTGNNVPARLVIV